MDSRPSVGMQKIQNRKNEYVVGVISDTHGRLPLAALNAFRDCHVIIHAGDIDSPEILNRLGEMAPTIAVRGNMDQGNWAEAIPIVRSIQVGEVVFFIRHILNDSIFAKKDVQVIIHGHTHQPEVRVEGTRIFLNPGSASAPRNQHGPTVAKLYVRGKDLKVEHIALDK